MDGEYFWVIMLVLYLIFQVLGGRKKKKRQRRPDAVGRKSSEAVGRGSPELAGEIPAEEAARSRSRGSDATDEEPTSGRGKRDPELDDALREIRRALGFPEADVPPRPERRPEVIRETPEEAEQDTGWPTIEPSTASRPPTQPRSGAPERPKFARPIPSSPPTDQRRGTGAELERSVGRRGSRRGESIPTAPIPASASVDSARPRDIGLSALKKRLHAPETLREAFVIKEILDPPRSKRSRRKDSGR